MTRRYAAKRDKNEALIIEALSRAGATVTQINGKGIPDLAVGIDGRTFLLEIKGRYRKLTPDQIEWHQNWQGQVEVVQTPEEALRAIGR